MHQSKLIIPSKMKVVSKQTKQRTRKNMGLWRAKVPFPAIHAVRVLSRLMPGNLRSLNYNNHSPGDSGRCNNDSVSHPKTTLFENFLSACHPGSSSVFLEATAWQMSSILCYSWEAASPRRLMTQDHTVSWKTSQALCSGLLTNERLFYQVFFEASSVLYLSLWQN